MNAVMADAWRIPHTTVGRRWNNLSFRREGRPLIPTVASTSYYGGGDGGPSADYTLDGEEMAPTKTGAKGGSGKNSPRSSAVRNTSP